MREIAIFVGVISIVVSLAYVSSVSSAWDDDELRQVQIRRNAIERRAEIDLERAERLQQERLRLKESQ